MKGRVLGFEEEERDAAQQSFNGLYAKCEVDAVEVRENDNTSRKGKEQENGRRESGQGQARQRTMATMRRKERSCKERENSYD